MAQKRPRGRAVKTQARPKRSVRWALFLAVILLVGAPSLHRSWWRWGERSTTGAAVEALRSHGCLTCHTRSRAGFQWRGDGASPVSPAVIKDALVRGRPAVPGMPGPMPSYGDIVGKGTLDRLAYGTEVSAGMIDWDTEPEIRIGLTIAGEMGCFDCHGPMGAGGVANPGTLGGRIPGFFGKAFERQSESLEGIEGIIRKGRPAQRAWWSPWKRPALDMPAYGDRLDSTEIELLAQAIRTVNDHDD